MDAAAATPGVPFPAGPACFFLDFDGTLVDHAATPDDIRVPEGLVTCLARLQQEACGALAILTGRALPDIDRHLAPLRLPTAAVHGAMRRTASGQLREAIDARRIAAAIDTLRGRLQARVAATPGLWLEDKGLALAVHYRAAPQAAAAARAWLREGLEASGAGLELLEGDCVLEARPAGTDKGRAVAAFLAEPPFAGRIPVCIGNDATDQPALDEAHRRGGLAIAVGDRVQAAWRLPAPADVRRWLSGCIDAAARA